MTGKCLGTIVRHLNGSGASLGMPHTTMESPFTIRDTDVSVSWTKLVKQLLRTLHAETQACGGKGGSNLQHVQFAHLVGLVLSLQGCQEWHNIPVAEVHEQVVKQSKALMHLGPAKLSIVLPAPPQAWWWCTVRRRKPHWMAGVCAV